MSSLCLHSQGGEARFFFDMTEDQCYVVKQFLKGSDLFVSLPTGKSLCDWMLPGLCDTLRSRSGSLVLAVSPLVAVMKNQVDLLQKRGVTQEKLSLAAVYAVVLEERMEYFPQKWKHVA